MRRVTGLVRGQFASVCLVPVGGFYPMGAFRLADSLDIPPSPPGPPDKKGPYLVALSDKGRPAFPLSEPELHRRFAKLATDDDILSFAGRWGFLGHGVVPRSRRDIVRAEPLRYWRDEIVRMQGLLELWELVKSAKAASLSAQRKLGEYVKWQDDGTVFLRWPGGTGVMPPPDRGAFNVPLAWPGDALLSLERWKVGDVVGPARFYVWNSVNARLRGETLGSPCTCVTCGLLREQADIWQEEADAQGRGKVEVDERPDMHPRAVPSVWPNGAILVAANTLLVALYCLFALEISGKTPPARECTVCGELFKPPARRDARTCSPACRQRKHRQELKRRAEERKRAQAQTSRGGKHHERPRRPAE